MYIKAKRWRETKYKANAALRNPRGEVRDRDDLRKKQETKKKYWLAYCVSRNQDVNVWFNFIIGSYLNFP